MRMKELRLWKDPYVTLLSCERELMSTGQPAAMTYKSWHLRKKQTMIGMEDGVRSGPEALPRALCKLRQAEFGYRYYGRKQP